MRSQPENPALAAAFALLFVGFMMPVLVVIAWRMALQFDPFTMNFFAKHRSEPTADTPGQMRIVGGVIIGLGVLVGGSALQAIRKRTSGWKGAALLALAGLEIAAFGAAYFVAADAAKARIEQEQLS